jgi:hypothetical protein
MARVRRGHRHIYTSLSFHGRTDIQVCDSCYQKLRKRNRKLGYVCADLCGVEAPARWVDVTDPEGIPIKLCGTCWGKRVLRTKLYADIAAAERAIASRTLAPTTSSNPTCILGCRCDKSTPSVWQWIKPKMSYSNQHIYRANTAYYVSLATALTE